MLHAVACGVPNASSHDTLVEYALPQAVSAALVNPVPGAARCPLQIVATRSVQSAPSRVETSPSQTSAFAQYFAANASHSAAVAGAPDDGGFVFGGGSVLGGGSPGLGFEGEGAVSSRSVDVPPDEEPPDDDDWPGPSTSLPEDPEQATSR